MSMPSLALLFSALYIVIGFGGWSATGFQHMTALIPVAFGVALFMAGLLARRGESMRRHAMHGAAMVGLFGFLGTAMGLYRAVLWAAGTAPDRPAAVVSQSLMAVLSLVWIGLCVRSFREARRRQAATKTS